MYISGRTQKGTDILAAFFSHTDVRTFGEFLQPKATFVLS